MYGDPYSRKHINSDMKRYIRSLRTDLILYGTLSQDQFQSIRQFLIFEIKGTVEQVKNFSNRVSDWVKPNDYLVRLNH